MPVPLSPDPIPGAQDPVITGDPRLTPDPLEGVRRWASGRELVVGGRAGEVERASVLGSVCVFDEDMLDGAAGEEDAIVRGRVWVDGEVRVGEMLLVIGDAKFDGSVCVVGDDREGNKAWAVGDDKLEGWV